MRFGWTALCVLGACNSGFTGAPTGDTATGTTSTGQVRYQSVLALTGDPNNGSFEFTQQCLQCHPAPGATNPLGYPPLENTVPRYTDGQLVLVVIEGFVDVNGVVVMPDYAEYFTNQDVADLVAYMRLTYGSAAPPAR